MTGAAEMITSESTSSNTYTTKSVDNSNSSTAVHNNSKSGNSVENILTPGVIKKIVTIPDIAWPTVLLGVVCLLTSHTIAVLFYFRILNTITAVIINTVILFASFTPLHDSAHGSISTKNYKIVNTLVGYNSAYLLMLPYLAFKHLHLQHHKHTNVPDKDPDYYAGVGPSYLLPIQWFTTEYHYYYMYLSNIFSRPKEEYREVLLNLLLYVVYLVALAQLGLFAVALYCWVLPGRVAVGLLSFAFDYLPHRPHTVTRFENVYEATSVTALFNYNSHHQSHSASDSVGKSDHNNSSGYNLGVMLLTWPLLHQNYHNIHHLAPYVPFYHYSTVWHAYKKELLARGTKVKSIM